jgi:hypothetical protein
VQYIAPQQFVQCRKCMAGFQITHWGLRDLPAAAGAREMVSNVVGVSMSAGHAS